MCIQHESNKLHAHYSYKVRPLSGLDTDVKPLISHSTTEEFNSPQFFHRRLKTAEDEIRPLSSQYAVLSRKSSTLL
eukprot:6993592-Pyramimonas_sp.AAC.1